MSSKTPSGQVDFSNKETFTKDYLNNHRVAIIVAIIILVVGIIIFVQTCGFECSGGQGCDPCGIMGSSVAASNGVDDSSMAPTGTCVAFGVTLGLIIIVFGTWMLTYYTVKHDDGKKLMAADLPLGAVIVTGKKGHEKDPELLTYQTGLLEADCVNKGINPYKIIKNPLDKPKKVVSDTDSSSGSDTDSS
jgi:uncharacterized membrane protein YidH (DUF202 family)